MSKEKWKAVIDIPITGTYTISNKSECPNCPKNRNCGLINLREKAIPGPGRTLHPGFITGKKHSDILVQEENGDIYQLMLICTYNRSRPGKLLISRTR